MEGKSNEIIEIELLLNYEKNKSNNLELEIKEKDQEIMTLKEACSKMSDIILNKDKEKEGYLELIDRLKLENIELNKHIERYQGLLQEFEDIHEKYNEKNTKTELYLKFEEKIEELNQENKELQQNIQVKDAEYQYLQNTNRELTRHNSHLEKAIQKLTKEKPKNAENDKKIKEEIKQLKQANEALKDELKKKPADSAIKETEKKIQELEKMVDDFCNKKKSSIHTNDIFSIVK